MKTQVDRLRRQETEDLADSEPAEFVVLPQMRIRLRPSLAVRCEIGADEAMFVDEESGKTMRLRIAPSVSHLVCALAKRRYGSFRFESCSRLLRANLRLLEPFRTPHSYFSIES